MAAKSSIDLKQDPKVMVGSRLFDAPRSLVYEAWTDPVHLARWFGPNGFSITTHAFDFRVGGVWRFTMHGPDGRDYPNRVTYDEIVPAERIAYHHDDDGSGPVEFRTIVTFADEGGKTRLTMHATFPTAEERARLIREVGADKGMLETLSRLGDHLAATGAAGGDAASVEAKQEFTISRVFDAPRDLVWAVHTEPRHMVNWWGPKGFKVKKLDIDLRPGGTMHYCIESPTGNEMWGRFVYREIVPPERLVWINSFSDPEGGVTRHPMAPDWPLEMLSILTFADEPGGKTRITLRWSPHNATEAERRVFAAGHDSMRGGWTGTMDTLEAYLAQAKEGRS